MSDPINDGFIAMCRERIPDSYMAQEFAIHFCRLEPQFNSKTRINIASFSDNKLLLAQNDTFINDYGRIRQRKTGIKAWFQRLFSSSKGWEYVPSPYAPYPVLRRLPVKHVARAWSRANAELAHSGDPRAAFMDNQWWDHERMIAKVWYVYDGLTDTLYIEWNRDWLR